MCPLAFAAEVSNFQKCSRWRCE